MDNGWASLAAGVALVLVLALSFWPRAANRAKPGAAHGGRCWRPSILNGSDGNPSTSKFTGWFWLLAIAVGAAYLLVRCATSDLTLREAGLDPLNPGYLVLLGIPYAALVGAKGVVAAKTSAGTLQKPNDRGGNILRNDLGGVDFIDIQYLVFNGVLWLYVVVSVFFNNELPDLPDTLLGLTGVSATAFVAAKVAAKNPPTIESATVEVASQGKHILTIRGKNLLKPRKGSDQEGLEKSVSVGGVKVVKVSDWRGDEVITVTLEKDPGLLAFVAVTTDAGVTATGSIT